MAPATSLAAALARSGRVLRIVLAMTLTVAAATSAFAADQIYIWRDPSGLIRFSPVQTMAPPRQARDDDKRPIIVQCSKPVVVVAQP